MDYDMCNLSVFESIRNTVRKKNKSTIILWISPFGHLAVCA